MKGFKYFFTLASLALCLAVMVFGVMAASQISFTVTSTISYTVEDVFVEIETRIYSSNITFKSNEELADAAKQMQQSDFNILNNINTLPNGSSISSVQLYNTTTPSTFTADNTDYMYKYRTADTSENPPDLKPKLEYTTSDGGKYTFFIVIKVTNISDLPISAFVMEDSFVAPENSYVYKQDTYSSLSTKNSYGYIVFAFSLADFTQNIDSSTFNLPIKITKDEEISNFANFTTQTQTTRNLFEMQALPVTGESNPARINVVDELYYVSQLKSYIHTALLNFEYVPTTTQDITLTIMAHNADGSVKTYGTDWAINLVVSYLVAGVKIYTYNDYMQLNADDTGLVPITSFTATPNEDSSLSVTIPESYMTAENLRDGKFIFCIPSMFISSTGYYRITANVAGVTAINYKQDNLATSAIAPVGNISVAKPTVSSTTVGESTKYYSYFNASLNNIPENQDVILEYYTDNNEVQDKSAGAYIVYDDGTNNLYSTVKDLTGAYLDGAISQGLGIVETADNLPSYGILASVDYMNSTRFNIPSSLIVDGTLEFGIINLYKSEQSNPLVTLEGMLGDVDDLPEDYDGTIFVLNNCVEYTYHAATKDWWVTGLKSNDKADIVIEREINFVDENGEIPTGNIHPVTGIDTNAFLGHSEITRILIPDSIEVINAQVFRDCTGLTSISIPSSVRHMAYGVFWGCNNIESVEIDTDNQYYKVEGNCIISIQDGAVHSGFKNSVIPTDSSITKINTEAFAGIDIESIVIPDNIVEIKREAFFWCRKLTSIAIGNGLSVVGESVLRGCSLLETVTVSQSNTHYYAENNCLIERSSKTIRWVSKNSTIPTSADITTIGSWAFASTQTHTHITIPANIVTIEEYAFGGCTRLTNIYIPDTVKNIYAKQMETTDGYYYTGPFVDCSSNLVIYYNERQQGWQSYWTCNGADYLQTYSGVDYETYLQRIG